MKINKVFSGMLFVSIFLSIFNNLIFAREQNSYNQAGQAEIKRISKTSSNGVVNFLIGSGVVLVSVGIPGVIYFYKLKNKNSELLKKNEELEKDLKNSEKNSEENYKKILNNGDLILEKIKSQKDQEDELGQNMNDFENIIKKFESKTENNKINGDENNLNLNNLNNLSNVVSGIVNNISQSSSNNINKNNLSNTIETSLNLNNKFNNFIEIESDKGEANIDEAVNVLLKIENTGDNNTNFGDKFNNSGVGSDQRIMEKYGDLIDKWGSNVRGSGKRDFNILKNQISEYCKKYFSHNNE